MVLIQTGTRKPRGKHLAEPKTHGRKVLLAAASAAAVAMPGVAFASPTPAPSVNATAAMIKAKAALGTAPAFTVDTTADWVFSGIEVQGAVVEAATAADLAAEALAATQAQAAARAESQRTQAQRTQAQAELLAAAPQAQRQPATSPVAPVVAASVQATTAAKVKEQQATGSATTGARAKVLAIARSLAGTRYRAGGATPGGFDCSGYTSYVFRQVGVELPRSSGAQRSAGHVIPASQARPGDLVYWPGHVGIYTGNGQHIAARNPSTRTHEGPVYGRPTYVRVLGD